MTGRALFLGLAPAILVLVGAHLAGIERLWMIVLAYHFLCFAAACIGRADAGIRRHPGRRRIIVAIAMAAALAVGIFAVGRLAYAQGLLPAGVLTMIRSVEPWPLLAVYSLLVNPIAEEVYWRELVLFRMGIPAASVFFGLMHYAALVVFVDPLTAAVLALPTVAVGWWWGAMRRRSGSLWPCVIAHFGADVGILAFVYWLRG